MQAFTSGRIKESIVPSCGLTATKAYVYSPYDLRRDIRSQTRRCPTPPRIADSAKPAFILKHQPHLSTLRCLAFYFFLDEGRGAFLNSSLSGKVSTRMLRTGGDLAPAMSSQHPVNSGFGHLLVKNFLISDFYLADYQNSTSFSLF